MALAFKLPDIGEGVAEGEIVKWHVQPGDIIEEDQILVEVMTDKVTAEIPAPCSGRVEEIKYAEGDVVPVGKVIVTFDTGNGSANGSGNASGNEKGEAAPAEAPAAQPVGGAQTLREAPPAAAQTSAAMATVSPPPAVKPDPTPTAQHVLAAPATRRMARTMGVNLEQIAGTGPNGRITPADVQQAATTHGGYSRTASPAACAATQGALSNGASVFKGYHAGEDCRVPFKGMRRKIAEHLSHSKRTAPHFGYVDEVDMTELVALRDTLKTQAKAEGVSLTYLPFIIKAVIAGLKQYPMLNASLDDEAQEIIYKGQYNLGVAVATEDGLTVPVLHHADQKNLKTLAQDIADLSQKARDNKLSLQERQGGTFTLTNIGNIGGLFGLPIINHPEVAILGINAIQERPVVRDGQIVVRKMMYLSLSCDHRVVDGMEGVQFINTVKQYLESPARLLYDAV